MMGMKMQEMGIKNHKQRTSANVNSVALSLKINWLMDSCSERGETIMSIISECSKS